MIGLLATQAAVGYGEGDPNQQIHALVQQLSAESSANARDALANKIADVVRMTSDKAQIRVEAIDEIAGLLSHEDVVLWSALALGQMGPPAKRAVPSLEAALDREMAMEQACIIRTGVWPSDAICAALKKIDGAKRSKCLIP
jgi:hypothetical protein